MIRKKEFHERGVPKTAGKNIQKLRKLRELTQAELAKAIGADRTAVANWENGRYLPSEDMVDRLQHFFSTERAILLGNKTVAYQLSNVRWTHYKPGKSGTYLAYVKRGESREYALLDYDHSNNRWEEKTSTYINVENGRAVSSYTTFDGEVLQWTSFPLSDYDIADHVVGRRRAWE